MKILWYVLAAVLGAVSILSILRSAERLMTGATSWEGGVLPVIIGLMFLSLAWRLLQKARKKP